MKFSILTLGCKVNHYESEAMRELFLAAGWTDAGDAAADAYIINTCTVTGMSDAKSRQLIARAHKKNPNALIAAVGCYAQTAPDKVKALDGVGLVVGTNGRKNIVSLVEEAMNGTPKHHVERLSDMCDFEDISATLDGRTRATLKIQDGCVNFCSYCIIPYARGPLRSRRLDSIRTELERLAGRGYREIVLTGIHLASWGLDSGEGDLVDVIRLVDEIDGIERLRLGSLEPKFVDDRFARACSESRTICKQFHLSMQSGSDTVLERMKRRYTTADFSKSVDALRTHLDAPAITTDIIAGFVGETDEEHRETLAYTENIGFSRIHVFPYSVRSGTVAQKLPGHLEKQVKEARARELITLGKRLEASYLDACIGKTLEVLAETDGTGYAREYVRVKTAAAEGSISRILITGREENILFGKEGQ